MIIKSLSGFYYVKNEEGIFQCRGRGVFRKRNVKPIVGDQVQFAAENETDGYILDVFERKNELIRPPIANVDQAILVFSAAEPDFNPLLLDRFLVQVEANHLLTIIVISKIDLLNEKQYDEMLSYKKRYEQIGYRVLFTSIEDDSDVQALTSYFPKKVSVIAGQSGVGKSSLLNKINPDLQLKTAEISAHLGRGRHTTRHVELIPVAGGLVADTPGFSSIDFTNIEAEQLSNYFIEMREVANRCKFRLCTHTNEPHCAVKKGVEDKTIAKERYDHYCQFLEEIKNQKKRY